MTESATLLRGARAAAGLSVRSLASKAGVSASTVSRIESARMDPTFSMLRKLLAAAGHRLEVTATATPVVDIATLEDAWRPSPRGDIIDWTRLRAFLDHLALHPETTQQALNHPPRRSGSELLDNLLAGIAETQSDETGLSCPAWTHNVPKMSAPWSTPGTPRQITVAQKMTPQRLATRGITLARSSLWRDDVRN